MLQSLWKVSLLKKEESFQENKSIKLDNSPPQVDMDASSQFSVQWRNRWSESEDKL